MKLKYCSAVKAGYTSGRGPWSRLGPLGAARVMKIFQNKLNKNRKHVMKNKTFGGSKSVSLVVSSTVRRSSSAQSWR